MLPCREPPCRLHGVCCRGDFGQRRVPRRNPPREASGQAPGTARQAGGKGLCPAGGRLDEPARPAFGHGGVPLFRRHPAELVQYLPRQQRRAALKAALQQHIQPEGGTQCPVRRPGRGVQLLQLRSQVVSGQGFDARRDLHRLRPRTDRIWRLAFLQRNQPQARPSGLLFNPATLFQRRHGSADCRQSGIQARMRHTRPGKAFGRRRLALPRSPAFHSRRNLLRGGKTGVEAIRNSVHSHCPGRRCPVFLGQDGGQLHQPVFSHRVCRRGRVLFAGRTYRLRYRHDPPGDLPLPGKGRHNPSPEKPCCSRGVGILPDCTYRANRRLRLRRREEHHAQFQHLAGTVQDIQLLRAQRRGLRGLHSPYRLHSSACADAGPVIPVHAQPHNNLRAGGRSVRGSDGFAGHTQGAGKPGGLGVAPRGEPRHSPRDAVAFGRRPDSLRPRDSLAVGPRQRQFVHTQPACGHIPRPRRAGVRRERVARLPRPRQAPPWGARGLRFALRVPRFRQRVRELCGGFPLRPRQLRAQRRNHHHRAEERLEVPRLRQHHGPLASR